MLNNRKYSPMKTFRYLAIASVLSLSFACTNNSRDSATLGGTKDTTNVTGGSNAAATNPANDADTSNNGNKNKGKDSTSNGNANPTGHLENDTVSKQKPVKH